MFAAVVRPKRNSFSVPPSGLIWRPAEDGRVSLAFPSGCFVKDADTSCIVKVNMFFCPNLHDFACICDIWFLGFKFHLS